MNKFENFTTKNKTDTVYVLIIFFIVLISALSLYLIRANSIIQSDTEYKKIISELHILNKGFDNFFLKSTTFNNYDLINKNIKDFEEKLEILSTKNKNTVFKDKYNDLLNRLKNDFKDKKNVIESFKSENALLISSIHYLNKLNELVSKERLLDKKDIDLMQKTLSDIMLYYINTSFLSKNISANVKYFSNLHEKNKLNELKMFIAHANKSIQRIDKLSKIKNKKYFLNDSIKNLELFLNKKFTNAIYNGRIVVVVLLIIAFFFLAALLIMYKRTLKVKDDLISFTTAVENSYNSIVITDAEKNIIYVNDIVLKETGYEKHELLGQNPRILKSGDKSDEFYQEMHKSLDKGNRWEGEFINKRKDGTEFYEKASILPIFQDSKLVNYLAVKLNITDYIIQQQKVKHMAYHDSLTSLPNRTNVEEYLEINLPIAKRNNHKIAILFIDIDNFKTINDTLGHDVGDDFIKECAKMLRSVLRKSDILARIGGDEFLIILESIDTNYSAADVSTKIIDMFQKPIDVKNNKLTLTLSIGISIFPNDADNYITLFKCADMALYKAKESGKNNFQYYKKKLSVNMHGRLNIEQALKGALKKDEIFLVYQPKYNIASKEIVGFETLARWENEKLGLIPPDKFITIAESTNDILEIGLFIFKKACIDFKDFREINTNLQTISINISTVQLYQDSFIKDIMNIIDEVGIEASSIILEITETHIMKNIFYSMRVLNELKTLGFSVSIDDFGTGYSSLNYLKQLPINELKIDKSFINDLPYDLNDVAISKAIISLSKNMGYVNVAEGIETTEQEEFLLSGGCEIGQGYLFCKPKIKDEIIQILRDKTP
ncbi:EAL domain-containing protein [Sulfurimonas lithotrophica]|uniref:EAL domain-containing protein n=1 Tax=Sulfurimonas lithotrophica TaxID=2590022 RepID=A0A5P8P0E8_9BACT|nr:EAL domain-containing protein [Sulfurimonas lithotrophica]QFR49154.1 EAL domain-containing protein [Sulfurimonas lithotrophica]